MHEVNELLALENETPSTTRIEVNELSALETEAPSTTRIDVDELSTLEALAPSTTQIDVSEHLPSITQINVNEHVTVAPSITQIDGNELVTVAPSTTQKNINDMLPLETETPSAVQIECDSLENECETDSLQEEEEQKPCVKDLKSVFEEPKPKFYDRDSLPPCLRARNLKNQMLKTARSLDEDEFKKECTTLQQNQQQQHRRKSMDEIHVTVSATPKLLNQPKQLPTTVDDDDVGKLATMHMTHSTPTTNLCEQLRRDRIEKYKEARRKFLQDKYRSESFKEDKDVLLSRLKVFKKNLCDESPPSSSEEVQSRLEDLSIKVMTRRNNRRGNNNNNNNNNGDDDVSSGSGGVTSDSLDGGDENKSFRTKAAMFERKPDDEVEVFIRERRRNDDGVDDDGLRSERRRHTYDSRERETELDRVRRISLENKSPR